MVGKRLVKPSSIPDRVLEYGKAVADRMGPKFAAAGSVWPPRRVLLVAFKDEKRLELFVSDQQASSADFVMPGNAPSASQEDRGSVPSDLRHVVGWPILAASGRPGPKLRAGDLQVPEGLYPVESLNPMSRFHLALRVGYPNDFDCARAREDGREDLGGDIMVHGSDMSVGCLAMGDEAAEDLFVITALAGVENVSILLAPCDLRVRRDALPPAGSPPWTAGSWNEIRSLLEELP